MEKSEFKVTFSQIKDKLYDSEIVWKDIIEKHAGYEDELLFSFGDIAKSFDADAAWRIAAFYWDSEKSNILKTMLPSIKRACSQITEESIPTYLPIIENYVLNDVPFPENFSSSISDKIKLCLKTKNLSQKIENVLEALLYFVAGIHNKDPFMKTPKGHNLKILTAGLAPTHIRLFVLNDEEESLLQVEDICAIYPLTIR